MVFTPVAPLAPAGRGRTDAPQSSDLFILLMIIVAITGAATRQPIVAAMGGLALVLGITARMWTRLALEDVAYYRNVSLDRLFIGDEFTLTITIDNKKPLPLPWIRADDYVPLGLKVMDAEVRPVIYLRAAALSTNTSLAWYERVHIKYRLRAERRGFYQLGPATLSSGDIFGLYSASREYVKMDSVLVYPRVLPLGDFYLPSAKPIGDARSPSLASEDPSRPRSLREYHPSDGTRRIDWKATARRRELLVRTYDPSVAHFVAIIVDVVTAEHPWEGYSPDLLERVVTAAASIATRSAELGYRVGLVTNASALSRDSRVILPPGSAPGQLRAIMEVLGMARAVVTRRIEEVVQAERQAIPVGSTVVVISSVFSEGLIATTEELAARGHPAVAVYVGSESAPRMSRRVEVRHMSTLFSITDAMFRKPAYQSSEAAPGERDGQASEDPR